MSVMARFRYFDIREWSVINIDVIGMCKLCGESRKLLDSHVFPKFVTRWIKATGSGYLRFVKQPNLRAQDGPIRKWLCCECEQRFSINEAYFASHIFQPVLKASCFSFNHDARLLRFLVSVLWRILHSDLESERNADFFLPEILAAEEEWRSFLLQQRPLDRFANVHLFVTDLAGESPPGIPNFNIYCTRTLDGAIITDTSPRFVYLKFARFICVGILSAYNKAKWVGTRVNDGNGTLASPQEINDLAFGEFLCQRARASFEKFDAEISDNQRRVIESHIRQNSEKIFQSELGKAALTDQTNERRYKNFQNKIGRNQRCPCGSGLKFKKCHGANF